ncbi:hypothetical protein MMPV_006441 [Pyropia vietnamensis]
MVVRIRLARWGRRHLPFFRIVVADGRSPRDGRHLDVVGTYNAAGHSAAEVAARVKRVELDVARIKYWLSVGAQPSDTVARLLGYAGILPRPPLSQAARKTPATTRRVRLPETPLVGALAAAATAAATGLRSLAATEAALHVPAGGLAGPYGLALRAAARRASGSGSGGLVVGLQAILQGALPPPAAVVRGGGYPT